VNGSPRSHTEAAENGDKKGANCLDYLASHRKELHLPGLLTVKKIALSSRGCGATLGGWDKNCKQSIFCQIEVRGVCRIAARRGGGFRLLKRKACSPANSGAELNVVVRRGEKDLVAAFQMTDGN